eukprot:NODE_914_length_3092_cov_0.758102.p4 type:complete len:100 gc:universal NODE_914_length_3092_cov_0.758102:2100-1801(-)
MVLPRYTCISNLSVDMAVARANVVYFTLVIAKITLDKLNGLGASLKSSTNQSPFFSTTLEIVNQFLSIVKPILNFLVIINTQLAPKTAALEAMNQPFMP